MGFSKLMIGVFGIIFIVILYLIIYYSLKIMYKDVKGGGTKKSKAGLKRNFGIEVIETSEGSGIKEGSVFPIRESITIGRKDGNVIVIQDGHISSNHAKIIIRNNIAYLEDLNSTNGTFVNGERITGKVKLFPKDEIRLGNSLFKVLI